MRRRGFWAYIGRRWDVHGWLEQCSSLAGGRWGRKRRKWFLPPWHSCRISQYNPLPLSPLIRWSWLMVIHTGGCFRQSVALSLFRITCPSLYVMRFSSRVLNSRLVSNLRVGLFGYSNVRGRSTDRDMALVSSVWRSEGDLYSHPNIAVQFE